MAGSWPKVRRGLAPALARLWHFFPAQYQAAAVLVALFVVVVLPLLVAGHLAYSAAAAAEGHRMASWGIRAYTYRATAELERGTTWEDLVQRWRDPRQRLPLDFTSIEVERDGPNVLLLV